MSDFLAKTATEGVERDILDIARGLGRKLKASNFDLQLVIWSNRGKSDWPVFSTGFRRTTLILPSRMRGKLEPKEWKPLIASSLLYALRTTRLTVIMPRIILPLSFVLGGMATLGYALRSNWNLVPTIPVVYGIVTLLITLVVLAREERKSILDVDGQVAELVGTTRDFVDVLAQIEREVGQPLPVPTLTHLVSFRPTIRERIQNLAKLEMA